MNGSIDNLHVLLTAYRLRVDGNGFYLIQIKFVYLFIDNLNQRIGRVQYRMQTFNILGTDFVHLVDDALVVGGQYLGTIIPVSLVTVVFFRIVGSRKDDSTLATQLTNRKRHFRRRTHVVEQRYLYAVCRKNIGRNLGKQTAVVTTVMTYHYGNLLQILEVLIQIIGQALRSCPHRVNVHTVRAHSHDAAQTARSEFQILIKRFHQIRLVGIVEHLAYFRLRSRIIY